jgi:hypothetical protein
MNHQTNNMQYLKCTLSAVLIACTCLIGCGPTSSPEGRMSIKIEKLQREMIDSLRQQNGAILDSLAAIRAEINQLKQAQK